MLKWIVSFCCLFIFYCSLYSAEGREPFSPKGQVRVKTVRVLTNKDYFIALTKKISQAEKSVNVCIYLFKTSTWPGNLATRVMGQLIKAAGRGVKVKVLLEQNDRTGDRLNQYNRNTAKKLREAGIEVRFDKKEINTHSKLVIIDDRWVFVGSHNFTHTGLGISNETSLLVESGELAETLVGYIQKIGNESEN